MEKNNYHEEWYIKNKESVLKKSKDWYAKNKNKRKITFKSWYERNKERSKNNSKRWYVENKPKKSALSKIWYEKNKENHSAKMKIWRDNNKEKIKKLTKNWYKNNKERVANKTKVWYEKNKERKNLTTKIWYEKNRDKIAANIRHKRKVNPTFRLTSNLRRRTLLALKGKNKSASTMVLLGISNIEFLWVYLEKLFKPGMTRENHGKWHVDHIKPCSSFDLTKASEQRECFHYTNLQPLWARENLAKGSKIS